MNGRSRRSFASDGPAFTRPTGRRRLRRWTRPGTSTASPWGYVSRSTRWPRPTRARAMASTASGVPRTSKKGCGARNRMRRGCGLGAGGGLVAAVLGLLGVMGQELLRVNGGHASAPGAGRALPMAMVAAVPRRVAPGHVGGGRPVAGEEVAGLVHLEDASEERGVGLVSDGHEDAAGRELLGLPRLEVLHDGAGHALALPAQDLLHDAVPEPGDLGVLERAVLHDLRGAQGVATVDDRDLGAELGEEGRLFHGRVAASDHEDVLVLVEEAVAGGAGGNAADLGPEIQLLGQPEPAGPRAGGDDEGLRAHLFLVEGERERTAREIHLAGRSRGELAAEPRGLAAEAVHQLRAEDPFGEAGIVVDVGGQHELAARHVGGILTGPSLDDQGLEVAARGVKGRGQPRRPRAQDHDPVLRLLHGRVPPAEHGRQDSITGARGSLDSPPGRRYGLDMPTAARIDGLLSILNATDVGTLDSVAD